MVENGSNHFSLISEIDHTKFWNEQLEDNWKQFHSDWFYFDCQMPFCKLYKFFSGKPATSPPYIDMSTKQNIWRGINGVMAGFFLVSLLFQLNSYDWWLFGPFYAIPCLLSASIVVCPKSVDNPLWRVLCANVIVLGLIYLLYLFWVVREVALYGYLQNPMDFSEGRHCAGLAIAVLWSVVCRMTAKNSTGIMVHIRLLTLVGIILSCLPMIAWSMCFYAPGQNMLPYCKGMLATGDKDL